MRLFFLVSLLVLTLSCSVSKVELPASKPTEAGLVSFYKFDGNSKDSKGKNHGVTNRMRYSAFDKRNTQGIADLDGSGSHVLLPDEFDLKDRTISFWVRAKEVPTEGAIILASDNPTIQYGLMVFAVKQENQSSNLTFNFSGQVFKLPIEKGKWYHVGASLKDKNYRYYLNGKLISSGTFANYIKSGNGYESTLIGCSRVYDRFFIGSIDDLRIYNRTLTDEEVAVLATP